MARPSKPWWRSERNAWFVTVRGTVYNLGPDRDAAMVEFHRLMAGEPHTPPVPRPAPVFPAPVAVVTVRDMAERYLADLKNRVSHRTHYVADCYLKPVLAAIGDLDVSKVNRRDFEAAVLGHGEWNQSTRYHVLTRIAALFNWAVREELVPASPVRGLVKPRPRSRGAEVVLADGDFGKLLAAAPEYLRSILIAMCDTGARPGEVVTVTARQFDPGLKVWVLESHKTAHSTGKPRVIHLTDRVVEMCKVLAERYPTGPLFRTSRGKVFPPSYYLPRLVRDLRRKLKLPESVIPYSCRHSRATQLLINGTPDAIVAELLGHSSTGMIHRHYNHCSERTRELKAALDRVKSSA